MAGKENRNSGRSIDMLTGPLLKKILLFSMPLMAANVLQLLFNAADVVVVGKFASYESLAAVGSTSPIVNLIVNLLIGISVGVNVVIARYLGEGGKQREISRAIHTAVAVALIGGAALGASGALLTNWLLRLVSTPEDIFPLAGTYLHIYFLGTPGVMLYNYGAAALRAQGDTRRPLLYLFLSGLVNVALNLYFVIVLGMDVAGVALATIISEYLSAVLILISLIRAKDELHFSWRSLRIDRSSLARMAHVGIPAGIQGCLFSLSNVAIQGAINSYGSIVMAGCSAAASIDGFIYVSMNAFHHAAQTFISQNIGARRYERVRPILRKCLYSTVVTGLLLCSLTLALDETLLRIYNGDPAVVSAGVERLYMVVTFYIVFGISDVLIGSIRGCGCPVAPVVINLLGTCVFRLIWIAALNTRTVSVRWVYASYPISWVLIFAALTVFWLYLYRKRVRPEISTEEGR